MLLLVKLVRCVVCVHALIPTAASTYQLYHREPRENLLQSSPPGAPSTAPAAGEEDGSSPAVPRGRAAAAPRPLCASPGLRAALRVLSSGQVSSPPPPRSAHPTPRPRRWPCRGRPPQVPPGRGAARGRTPGGKRGKLGGERGSAAGRPPPSTRWLPRLIAGVGAAAGAGGGTGRQALMAMVLGGCCWGCTPCPLLSAARGEGWGASSGEQEGKRAACRVRGSRGRGEKGTPSRSRVLPNLPKSSWGTPKPQTCSSKLLVAGSRMGRACGGELDCGSLVSGQLTAVTHWVRAQ